MKKVLFNWSGGKDSSLCLHKVLASGEYEVSVLLTTLNKENRRISMHGISEKLLDKQAEFIGVPLHKILLPGQVSMDEYDRIMQEELQILQKKNIYYSVFGDIFLDDLRTYREDRLAKVGIRALFPLWHHPTDTLAEEFIELGFKSIVVCVDGSKLDRSFVGREYDYEFLDDLPDGVDPCGENGEFHTFVYDGPIFSHPIPFKFGEIVQKKYAINTSDDDKECHKSQNKNNFSTFKYWYCDLIAG